MLHHVENELLLDGLLGGVGQFFGRAELHLVAEGPVPLYSANVLIPFGMRDGTRLDEQSFDVPSVLWGIDGDFTLTYKAAGDVFDHTRSRL